MSLIVQKQYSLRNQPFYKLYGTQIALVIPDAEGRALYGQKLLRANVELDQYESLGELLESVLDKSYEVIIVSPLRSDLPKLAQLKSFVPDIPLITMSHMMPETQLDGIMKLGVTMHINRDFSRPRDLLVALEEIVIAKYQQKK